MATLSEVWTIARLYEAGLNREGVLDRPGLNGWIERFDDGFTYEQIATGFLYSAEFTRKVGRSVDELSDLEFVNVLYNNVLGRDGLPVGVGAWTNALSVGLKTREQVLYDFAVSQENVNGSRYVENLRFENGDWWYPDVPVATVDLIPGDASTMSTMFSGNTFTSEINFAGDRDWIALDTVANNEYTVDLTGQTLNDPLLRIFDSSGAVVVQNNNSHGTLDSRVLFTPDSDARYYIEASGVGTSSGTYQVLVTSTAPTDIIGGIFTRASIEPGETLFSDIGFAGDRDWFEIRVDAETRYEVTLFGNDFSTNSLVDPYLRIYDSNGTLVDSDDDGAGMLNALITATPSGAGTYYIAAGEFGDDSTGFYGLSVDAAFMDIAGDTTTTVELALNERGQGTIGSATDSDWFDVVLRAHTPYVITLDDADGSPVLDPVVSLYDSFGTLVASNDDGGAGRNSLLDFTPAFDATYYVAADGFGASTGSYELLLAENNVI